MDARGIRTLALGAALAAALAGCSITENFDGCPIQPVGGMFLGDSAGGLDCLDNPKAVEIRTEAVPGQPFVNAQIWASLIGSGNSLFGAISETVVNFEGDFAAVGVRRFLMTVKGYGVPCRFRVTNDLGEELEFGAGENDAETVEVLVGQIGGGAGSRIEEIRVTAFECEQDDFQAFTM